MPLASLQKWRAKRDEQARKLARLMIAGERVPKEEIARFAELEAKVIDHGGDDRYGE
jgi:hypothetical protein